MRQHDANGLELARFLSEHSAVARVNYPGLDTHPQYARARRLLAGAGGVVSFELHGGVEAAEQLVAGLELAVSAPTLGGVETLITRPAPTARGGLTAEERAAIGVGYTSLNFDALEYAPNINGHVLRSSVPALTGPVPFPDRTRVVYGFSVALCVRRIFTYTPFPPPRPIFFFHSLPSFSIPFSTPPFCLPLFSPWINFASQCHPKIVHFFFFFLFFFSFFFFSFFFSFFLFFFKQKTAYEIHQ